MNDTQELVRPCRMLNCPVVEGFCTWCGFASWIKAIDLDREWLGRMVRVTDHGGVETIGRLDRFELSADERTRVIMWIATEHPINESDGGGTFWSTFSNDRYIDRDAIVAAVGEVSV